MAKGKDTIRPPLDQMAGGSQNEEGPKDGLNVCAF